MRKKKLPQWFGLLYLVVGILWPFSVWADFRQMEKYYAMGIFSPERWAEIVAQQNYSMVNGVLLFFVFLFQFAYFYWGEDHKKQLNLLGTVSLFAALTALILLPRVMPLPQSNTVWVLDLVGLCVAIIYVLYKFFENKHQEEEYYE